MVIVNLKGGLGNQMFQYAVGRALSLKLKTELKLETNFLISRMPGSKHVFRNFDLSIFNIETQIANSDEINKIVFRAPSKNILRNLFTSKVEIKVVEKYFHYDESILKIVEDVYLDGYWQSPRYFIEFENIIKNDFSFKNCLTGKTSELQLRILSCNSVCINIRRTDYLTTDAYCILNQDYYSAGIKMLNDFCDYMQIFVFSDDVEWCKKNLKFDFPTTFVEHKYAGEKFQDYLQLMASCKYFIIPNSTFAWWAAFLAGYERKKIIAPKNWFTNNTINTEDLFPNSWIRL